VAPAQAQPPLFRDTLAGTHCAARWA